MDYEKKYNAVLRTATQWIKDGCTDKERICLECVFPELRESEDEQAIRIIKKRMCYDPVPISDEDRRIVEDWLEKQKEQKPWRVGANAYFTPEQKPSWSEEDEKMIKEALYCVGYTFGSTHPLVAWLKSLKPHWKPSEELIGCLERLIAFKNPEPEDIKGCESLLEHLKKLIV